MNIGFKINPIKCNCHLLIYLLISKIISCSVNLYHMLKIFGVKSWNCWLSFTEIETGTYHFKLLVPSVAAGAIIGKGGETIAQLQREKHAKVKMSKANDFYPGKL